MLDHAGSWESDNVIILLGAIVSWADEDYYYQCLVYKCVISP